MPYNFQTDIMKARTLTNKNASALTPWYFMKVSTTGFDVWDGSGYPIGVLAYNTNHDGTDLAKITAGTLTEGQTDTGKAATIIEMGDAYVIVAAGGTATKGNKFMLSSTNNGKVTDWTSGNVSYGMFLESGSAGDTVKAFIFVLAGATVFGSTYTEYDGSTGHLAISGVNGFAYLSKATAGSYTLAAPACEGIQLKIRAKNAVAHTIDAATPYFYANGTAGSSSTNLATLGGAIGDGLDLESIKDGTTYAWNIVRAINATLS